MPYPPLSLAAISGLSFGEVSVLADSVMAGPCEVKLLAKCRRSERALCCALCRHGAANFYQSTALASRDSTVERSAVALISLIIFMIRPYCAIVI